MGLVLALAIIIGCNKCRAVGCINVMGDRPDPLITNTAAEIELERKMT